MMIFWDGPKASTLFPLSSVLPPPLGAPGAAVVPPPVLFPLSQVAAPRKGHHADRHGMVEGE